MGFKDKNAAGLAQKNYDKTYLGVSKIRLRLRKQEVIKRSMARKIIIKKRVKRKLSKLRSRVWKSLISIKR